MFAFSILPEIAFSETPAVGLQGIHKSELIKILGQPSRSSRVPSNSATNSSETLYYGNSQVSLVNDKVNSVFDLGELKMLLLRNKNIFLRASKNSAWEDWPNPWTPPKTLIVDIIRESK